MQGFLYVILIIQVLLYEDAIKLSASFTLTRTAVVKHDIKFIYVIFLWEKR